MGKAIKNTEETFDRTEEQVDESNVVEIRKERRNELDADFDVTMERVKQAKGKLSEKELKQFRDGLRKLDPKKTPMYKALMSYGNVFDSEVELLQHAAESEALVIEALRKGALTKVMTFERTESEPVLERTITVKQVLIAMGATAALAALGAVVYKQYFAEDSSKKA